MVRTARRQHGQRGRVASPGRRDTRLLIASATFLGVLSSGNGSFTRVGLVHEASCSIVYMPRVETASRIRETCAADARNYRVHHRKANRSIAFENRARSVRGRPSRYSRVPPPAARDFAFKHANAEQPMDGCVAHARVVTSSRKRVPISWRVPVCSDRDKANDIALPVLEPCGVNSHFEQTYLDCGTTCQGRPSTCVTKSNACVCNPGYFLDAPGGRCIRECDCGCMDSVNGYRAVRTAREP